MLVFSCLFFQKRSLPRSPDHQNSIFSDDVKLLQVYFTSNAQAQNIELIFDNFRRTKRIHRS